MSRRWLQFRLRTLLIAVIVCALPLAWYAAQARQHKIECEAVKAIESIPDTLVFVLHDDQPGFCFGLPPPSKIDLHWHGPSWVPRRIGRCKIEMFYRVQRVYLSGESYDDCVVEQLVAFNSLKELALEGTSVTPKGMKRLRTALPHAKIEYHPANPFG